MSPNNEVREGSPEKRQRNDTDDSERLEDDLIRLRQQEHLQIEEPRYALEVQTLNCRQYQYQDTFEKNFKSQYLKNISGIRNRAEESTSDQNESHEHKKNSDTVFSSLISEFDEGSSVLTMDSKQICSLKTQSKGKESPELKFLEKEINKNYFDEKIIEISQSQESESKKDIFTDPEENFRSNLEENVLTEIQISSSVEKSRSVSEKGVPVETETLEPEKQKVKEIDEIKKALIETNQENNLLRPRALLLESKIKAIFKESERIESSCRGKTCWSDAVNRFPETDCERLRKYSL